MSLSDIQIRLISLESRLRCVDMREEADLLGGIRHDLDLEVKSIKRQRFVAGLKQQSRKEG